MHNIENDSPELVQTSEATPLRERLADAFDLMIRPTDEVVVVFADFIRQARMRPVAFAASPIKLITERGSTTKEALYEIYERDNAWTPEGLNE